MLFNEKNNTLERFINEVNSEDRNAVSRFIHDLISWLKARLKGEKVSLKIVKLENRFAAVLRNVDTNAQKNNTTNDGDVQYDINKSFYSDFRAWVNNGGKDTNAIFTIGNTSDALKSIGVKSQDIKLRSGTVIQKINKHEGIDYSTFEQIPELLEHPIIVQYSDAIDVKTGKQKYDSRITVLGELYANITVDGKIEKKPVLVSLELLPTNQKQTAILDFSVITSAYGHSKLQNYLNENSILYIEPNKKRTDKWLSLNRLQLPLGESNYGSIRMITYADGKVKIENSTHKTGMQSALEKAGVIDSYGNNIFKKSENNSSPEQNNDGNSYSFGDIDKGNKKRDNISRANKRGELINEFYYALDKSEWKSFYEQIADKGFLEKTDVGDRVVIAIGDKLLIADRQLRGTDAHDFQIVAAYQEENGDWYVTNEIADIINESEDIYDQSRIESTIIRLGKKIDEASIFNRYDREHREFVNNTFKRTNGSRSATTDGGYRTRTYGEGISSPVKQNTQRINAGLNDSAFSMPGNDDEVSYSFEITPEQDTAYLDAINNGDMETAQRLVDEAAERAMLNSKIRDEDGKLIKVYHGSESDFTVFDKTKGRSSMDIQGMFFSPWELDAAGYGSNVRAFYLNIKNPANESTGYKALRQYQKENYAGVKAREHLERIGYDGVNNENEEYIAFNSSQIKSADPVTYDDNGNVIPLSERFNEDDNDIRYSFEDDVVDKTSSLAERVRLGEISQTEYLNELQRLMNEANEKYGAIPKGENPKVDVTVPKQVSDKRNTRRFVRTVLESGTLTDEMVADTDEAILKDALSYVPISNEEAIKVAANSLKNGTAERDWNKIANGDKIPSKHDIAKGEMLLKMYAENGDTLKVMELVADLSEVATRAGQSVQAFSLLKKMSGVGQLYYVQKTVDKLNRDLEKKHKDKHEQITIDETLAGQLVTAKPGTETENIVDEIMQDIAEQVPVTFLDKWNAWRYLAMLGNPRTHIRNLLGNAVFMPAIKLKDTIKTGMEKAFVSQENRTTSVIVNKEYKDFAKSDFEKVVDIITGNGKMNPSDTIREKQKIFKNKVLEGFRKFNFDALEKEDMIFLKMHYTRALGGFLQARNVDLNNVDEVTLNEARNYAIEEAQKATYRDMSALANTISRFSRSNKTANLLIEGILPFKKTPINIVKRGVQYSPFGILKALTIDVYDLKTNKITLSQYLDRFAASLSGTGIFALGMFLSYLGVAVGGLGYDDEDALKRLNGEQGYSIELFGKSYTVDWMAPVCIPFFMGVECMNMFSDSEKDWYWALGDAFYAALEPMINLSMLSGIRDTIAAARYSDAEDVLTQVGGETISNYFSQALPTLFGQVARTLDDTRRSNYVSGDATGFEKKLYEFFQNAMGKTPILENQKMPYTDAFGEKDTNDNFFFRLFENMLSPGYSSTIKKTDVNNELTDLFEQTGDGAVIPRKASKSFNVNGERIYLDAEQYTQYNTKKGQLSQNMLVDLFNSKGYKSMTYTKKAEAVSEVYKYANMLAKTEVSDYQLEGKYAKWKEYQGYGYDVSELIALDIADKDFDGSGGVSKSEYAEAVNNTDMSQQQKDLLIGLNEVEGKSDYSKNKTKGFGAGDWYYKENGQYVKITSAAELNQLRRNNVDTYVYTGNYTDEIDELWKAYRGY